MTQGRTEIDRDEKKKRGFNHGNPFLALFFIEEESKKETLAMTHWKTLKPNGGREGIENGGARILFSIFSFTIRSYDTFLVGAFFIHLTFWAV
jgi:hypothetical protein